MYKTSNLNDITRIFEQNAHTAASRIPSCKTKSGKRDLEIEARTWKQAADIMRNVEYIPPIAR
jgi:hypothetical protein